MTRLWSINGVAVLALALLAASPSASNADEKKAKNRGAARPLQVIMELSSTTNTQLKGALLELTEISVETAFGTASIPLHAVAGMRLPQKDTPTTTVILMNGDHVTGTTELHKLFVHTEWGKAEVEASSVVSIVFADGLTWTVENSLSGERYTLTKQVAQPQQVYYQY